MLKHVSLFLICPTFENGGKKFLFRKLLLYPNSSLLNSKPYFEFSALENRHQLFLYHFFLTQAKLGEVTLIWSSLVPQMVKNLPAIQDTQVQSLGWEDCLEKGMAIHSIPTPVFLPREFHGQRKSDRLPSLGSQRNGHD